MVTVGVVKYGGYLQDGGYVIDEESGIVIVDGQAMNKQAFEEYAKQNPDAELETVPFYYRRDAKEIKEDLKRDKTFRKGLRNITLFTVRDLETYIKKLGSGSKEFRTWLEESIAKPIREGRLKSVETIWNKTREYQKATKKIFGTDALGRNKMYDTDYKDHAILFAKKYTHSAGGTGGWDMVLVVYRYQSDVDWEDNPVYEEKVLWSCWNEPMRWSWLRFRQSVS